jgi:endonuclease/exonuclease/phosphatase family metal-dependent hydrolase
MKKTITFILLLALAASVLAQSSLQKADYSKSGHAVRLVAYNVGVFSKYMGDSMLDVTSMMQELDADAVAVCELDSCNRRNPVYQLEAFAEALGGWNYRYGSAMQWNGGAYGDGVVTGKRINRSYIVELPKGSGYEPRVCVVVETKDYVVAQAHLDHSVDAVRLEQARLLTDELKRLYGRSRKPVFLCGDLNTLPGGPVIRQLCEDWTVLSEQAATYPADSPRECIDYILALKNRARYKVLKTAVCTEFESADVTQTSDHLPVFVDIIIR